MKYLFVTCILLLMVSTATPLSHKNRPTDQKKMRIIRVLVKKYPSLKPNGKNWDLMTGADPYIAVMYSKTAKYTDVYGQALEFYTNYKVEDMNSQCNISMWDDDQPDRDDIMGVVSFIPNEISRYTRSFEIEQGPIALKVEIAWE